MLVPGPELGCVEEHGQPWGVLLWPLLRTMMLWLGPGLLWGGCFPAPRPARDCRGQPKKWHMGYWLEADSPKWTQRSRWRGSGESGFSVSSERTSGSGMGSPAWWRATHLSRCARRFWGAPW